MTEKKILDIYQQKSKWKWYLAFFGLIIIVISIFFTTHLTQKLAEEEYKKSVIWLEAYSIVYGEETNSPENTNTESDMDLSFHFKVMQSNTTIPILLVDTVRNVVIDALNYGEKKDADENFRAKEYKRLKASQAPYISNGPQVMYYRQSHILTLLQCFPYVQMLLIGFFVTFGYFSFSNARRSEQNQVWAGMAKETAHQLGTPISAILGWIDLLETTKGDDTEVQDVVIELRNDVSRLELVADRFSKIGSSPELTKINLYQELHQAKEYMQRRAPRKVEFIFPAPDSVPPQIVLLNAHLFAWVIENILRNALDAMDSKGTISVNVQEDSSYVNIEISDTGKGIPNSKWKMIFQPGYSTKKRGWGLGLSLAKRIIEDYHKGKIFVKESKEGVGTTFVIKMPKN